MRSTTTICSRWVASWGLLAFLSIGGRAWGAEAERLFTPEQAVETALRNNQTLLAAREDARISRQRVAEARSLFYPTLSVNLNASRYHADTYWPLSPDMGATLLRPSRGDGADNFYSGRVLLRHTVYNGGRDRANLRLAEAAWQQARIQEQEVSAAVTAEARKAFDDLLLLRQQTALATEAESDVRDLARRSTGAESAAIGAVSARLRRLLADLRRREERAYVAFLSALGLELYTQAELVGELSARPRAVDLGKLLARAQESRLELRGTEYQREIDQLSVNLTEAERFPVVALGAGYEYNDRAFPLLNRQWNTTLNVSLPIFDGFASRARIRRSRLQAKRTQLTRAALEDRINREVREAHGDFLYWQNEMDARAQDLRRLSALARGDGAPRSPGERARWRADLLDASQSYWEAVHGHRVAAAQLERAVGSPLNP
jgi:outer membrane protein TolC